jgi:hypothetical protein
MGGEDGGSRGTSPLVRLDSVTFLLPDATMGARITAQPFAEYVRRLQRAAEMVAQEPAPEPARPTTVLVTVAVKPTGDRRLWVDAEAPGTLSAALRSSFEARLGQADAPGTSGLIVFQLRLQVWGGQAPVASAPWQVPEAWKRVGVSPTDRVTVEAFVEENWNRSR